MEDLREISVNGEVWFYSRDYDKHGEVRLYNKDKRFVAEFKDAAVMKDYIENHFEAIETAMKFRESYVINELGGYGCISDEEKKEDQAKFLERFMILQGDISCYELAKVLDLNPSTVFNYRCGGRFPNAYALKRIADKCGVSIDWLLGRADK